MRSEYWRGGGGDSGNKGRAISNVESVELRETSEGNKLTPAGHASVGSGVGLKLKLGTKVGCGVGSASASA